MTPYRPIYDPELWRARAQATRIKADSLGPGQPRDRLLKVADEYDKLVIWNASSSHKRALGPLKESACGECRYERPADCAVGAESAGADVPGEASSSSSCCPARSLSERCRAILRCADGLPSKSVAAELGLHEHTVGKWRRRFLKDRCDGLLDEARPGRPRTINDDQVAAVIERTLRTTPADATHWSIRSMAAETGFSHTTIRRMWAAFGLQPHRIQTFKLSSDPLFVDKGTRHRRPLPIPTEPSPCSEHR